VTSRLLLRIRLRFHNHAPQQLAIPLAFHQQAADEVGGNLLGGAGKEGLTECLECWGGVVAMGVDIITKGINQDTIISKNLSQ